MSRRAAPSFLFVVFAVTAVILAVPRAARAQYTQSGTAERVSDPAMEVRTTRSGLVLELLYGVGVAGSSGYPNNSDQIGDPSYYSSSNLLLGTGTTFFVGGAFADYLNFGVWGGAQSFSSHDWRSTGGGGGVRLELFPLFSLVPSLKNLGVAGQFGIGGTTLQAESKNGLVYPSASGTESFIGLSAFYEVPLFKAIGGHVTLGPNLEYDNIYAVSIDRGSFLAGLRLAFYGGM